MQQKGRAQKKRDTERTEESRKEYRKLRCEGKIKVSESRGREGLIQADDAERWSWDRCVVC